MRGVVSPDKGRVQYRGGGITRQVDAPLQMHDDMHVFYQSGRDLLYARGTQRRGYPWDAYIVLLGRKPPAHIIPIGGTNMGGETDRGEGGRGTTRPPPHSAPGGDGRKGQMPGFVLFL